MKRRDFLKSSGTLMTQTLVASVLIESLRIPSAFGESVPLRDLQSSLNPKDGTILVPSDALFKTFEVSFNKRTMLIPQVRVLCLTPQGAATAIQWARSNRVPLALRSGGHSFEGLSQSLGLVLDARMLKSFEMAADRNSFQVGAGSLLGEIYEELNPYSLVIPAGSCPPVGATGHTLGGGYGLLSRTLGLACDSLMSVELVDAGGAVLNCSPSENADLFWALRGGGAGSFGFITKLQYKTHPVSTVRIYSMAWSLGPETAAHVMQTWQAWAPKAPREITSLMKVCKVGAAYEIRCIGQSVGTQTALAKELSRLSAIAKPNLNFIRSVNFIDAVHHFGGTDTDADSVYMKGKSDYIAKEMDSAALALFLEKMPVGLDVIFDCYGGAISDPEHQDAAFAHRAMASSLQYYTEWQTPDRTVGRMEMMRTFYSSLRSIMTGSAYFNYCDLDLKDYAQAYWGQSLPRLMEIKTDRDPANFFRHAQSVPLKKEDE